MADFGTKEEQILIVPEGRRIEKATNCVNCIHWISGEAAFEAWCEDPGVAAGVELVRDRVANSPLRIGDFDEGHAALELSQLIGKGMTPEEAYAELERRKRTAAFKQAGAMGAVDPAWADNRLRKYLDVHKKMLSGEWGKCSGPGVVFEEQTIGGVKTQVEFPANEPRRLLFAAYHCHMWSGREGWAEAHGPDRKLDPLPAELVEIAESKAKPVKP